MATDLVQSEAQSLSKKPRIDLSSDQQFVCLDRCNKRLHLDLGDDCDRPEIAIKSNDNLMNGDSGFQDFVTPEETMTLPTSEVNGTGKSLDLMADVDCDVDDGASDVSDLSCMSCLSDVSGQDWKPIYGPIAWVHHQMCSGTNPRDILNELIPGDSNPLPPDLDNITLWRIIFNMLSEPPRRKKLPNYNTIDDVVELIKKSSKIVVLTGAGVSVSSGIPDFRSRDGIYARLSKDFPDLPDPQAMFDINYFRKDPRPFYKFAKEIYPGQFKPSPSHKFIRKLEDNGKLLRNYTQNIDTLEQSAGIKSVITCHGSFATATCTRCKRRVDASEIRNDIFDQRIPNCTVCPQDTGELAVMKPDIVFFGEGLSDEFHNAMTVDKDECDLLIIMGSSLKVRPVALIPSSISVEVPQILINREPLNHLTFDVELLGDCDIIIQHLCERLGSEWSEIHNESRHLVEITELPKEEVNNNSAQNISASPRLPFEDSVNPHSEGDLNNTSLENSHRDFVVNEDEANQLRIDEAPAKESVALKLPDDKYLFVPPSRYLFKGAEVSEDELKEYNNKQQDDDEDTNSSSYLSASSSSSSDSSSSSMSSSPASTSSLLSASQSPPTLSPSSTANIKSSSCKEVTDKETPEIVSLTESKDSFSKCDENSDKT